MKEKEEQIRLLIGDEISKIIPDEFKNDINLYIGWTLDHRTGLYKQAGFDETEDLTYAKRGLDWGAPIRNGTWKCIRMDYIDKKNYDGLIDRFVTRSYLKVHEKDLILKKDAGEYDEPGIGHALGVYMHLGIIYLVDYDGNKKVYKVESHIIKMGGDWWLSNNDHIHKGKPPLRGIFDNDPSGVVYK